MYNNKFAISYARIEKLPLSATFRSEVFTGKRKLFGLQLQQDSTRFDRSFGEFVEPGPACRGASP